MSISVNDLVQREVLVCVSGLVSTLASGEVHQGRDLNALCEAAQELCYPLPDYEKAAREAGWKYHDMTGRWHKVYGAQMPSQDTAQAVCEEFGIDPYDREVYEHWAVTQWLGRKLQAKGEKVDFDFSGLVVWARTTTGQGIAQDYVIQQIHAELMK